MRTGITITVFHRIRLEAIIKDRNALQKHVWRSRIILLTADPRFPRDGHRAETAHGQKDDARPYR